MSEQVQLPEQEQHQHQQQQQHQQQPASAAAPLPSNGTHASHDEEKALKDTDSRSALRKRLTSDVDTRYGDFVLLGCFLCAGLTDSLAFDMYSCFVSMQTGNTIFIGLGASNQPASAAKYLWSKSLMAVFCFALGALFFSTFFRTFGPHKRWVLIAAFGLQTILVVIVASIVTAGVVTSRPSDSTTLSKTDDYLYERIDRNFPFSDYAPIALLAFQSAGQIVASRVLKFNSMPTVVLTSLYCDLMSDARLFTAKIKDNAERNRRVAGVCLLLGGAIAGGFISKSWIGFAGGLWIIAFLKACMTCSWFLFAAKRS